MLVLFTSTWSISLHSQCNEVIKEAKEKINPNSSNRDYEKAINLLLYAQGICPIEKKEEIDALITKTFKLITAEKDRATKAEIQAKNEKDNAIKAEKETKKTAISALNSALALELTATNPTLAIRVAEYNLNKNPDDESAHDMFKQIYAQENLFYKLSLGGHSFPVRAVDISDDSQYLVTASMDRKTNIWNLEGELVSTFQHIENIYDIDFSNDNNSIDTYVIDGNYKTRKIRWSFDGKKISDEVIDSKTSHFYTTSFIDPNGYLINNPQFQHVTNGIDKFEISRLLGHKRIVTNALGQEAYIYDAVMSKDGKYILTGGADKTAKFWVLPNKELKTIDEIEFNNPIGAGNILKNQLVNNSDYYYCALKVYNYENLPISDVDFSKDKTLFAVVNYYLSEYSTKLYSKINIIDKATQKSVVNFEQEGMICEIEFHDSNIFFSTLFADGKKIYWRIPDREGGVLPNDTLINLKLKVNLDSLLNDIKDFRRSATYSLPWEEFNKKESYTSKLIDTIYSPELVFNSYSIDNANVTAKKFDLPIPKEDSINFAKMSNDEEYIWTVSSNNEAILWEKGYDFYPQIFILDYGVTNNLNFSNNGNFFYFTTTKEGKEKKEYSQWNSQKTTDLVVLLVSISEGWTKEFKVLNQNDDYARVKSISLSEDGGLLAVTFDGDDNCILVWDVKSEEIIFKLPDYEDIESVRFIPQTKQLLAIRGNPGTAAVFINLDEGILERKIHLNSYPINSPIFEISRDESLLLIGGQFTTVAKTIDVWNYKTGKKITSIYNPYDINCATFLPQSNHVAIGSDDGTIKVFDLEGKLLKTFKGHKGVISDIDVSQGEDLIYSTGGDYYLRCWNNNGNEIWNKEYPSGISNLALHPYGEFILTNSYASINMISTKESFLDNSICEFDAYDFFIAGLIVNEDEASTDLEYEILALQYEQNRNWDIASKFYKKISNGSNKVMMHSKAFLLEEASNINQFEAYLDVTNGPMLLRFFQSLNEEIINEENKLDSLYNSLNEHDKKNFLKRKSNFTEIIQNYKKLILFSERSRVTSLVGNDLCNYINSLAWYCILTQRRNEAEGLLLRGVRLCGNNTDLRIRLVSTLLVQKKYTEAKEIIQSISLNENYKKRNSFHFKASFYNGFQRSENKPNREVLLNEIEFLESIDILDTQNPELNQIKKTIKEN